MGGALKIALTAPALEGRANESCIAFFAALLHVSRSTMSIVSGERSRNKTIRVAGISAAQLRAAIAKNL